MSNIYLVVGLIIFVAFLIFFFSMNCGKRKQKVHIEYDLFGYNPVDELIKAEQA